MATVGVHPPKTPVTTGSNAIAMATVPNICKMPGPPAPFVPTPLPNIGRSSLAPQGFSKTVKIEGAYVAIRGATFESQGDIASKGTGGGLISSNAHGITRFVGPGSMTVRVEGKNVHLLGDPMLNNCGPGGSPPNAATLAGVLQAPSMPTPDIVADLDSIAKSCNEKVNREAGYPKPGKPKPSGRECTTLGTKKHKCCEEKIKDADHPRVLSEQGYAEDGTPAGSRREAFQAGVEARRRIRAAGGSSKAQGAAFGAALRKNMPPLILDVVILKDSSRPPTPANVESVVDFKFNCKEEGEMSPKQEKRYSKAMGRPPRVIHAR